MTTNFAEILNLMKQKQATGAQYSSKALGDVVAAEAESAEERAYNKASLDESVRQYDLSLAQQKTEFEKESAFESEQWAEQLAQQKEEFTKSYELEKEEAARTAREFGEELTQRKYEYSSSLASELDMFSKELEASQTKHDTEMQLSWATYEQNASQFSQQLAADEKMWQAEMDWKEYEFGQTMKYNYWYAQKQIEAASAAGGGLSWLCTETDKQIGLSAYMLHAINRFRDYVWKNHKRIFVPYLRKGDQLVESINKKEGDKAKEVFKDFEESVLYPVMVAIDSCHMEDAFQLYRNKVLELVKEYLPEELETLKGLIVKDDERFLNAAV